MPAILRQAAVTIDPASLQQRLRNMPDRGLKADDQLGRVLAHLVNHMYRALEVVADNAAGARDRHGKVTLGAQIDRVRSKLALGRRPGEADHDCEPVGERRRGGSRGQGLVGLLPRR